ncbi:MAG: mycothiol system anti-sigma-R factor [Actinobacteria bacterium]|nr:mycothiol system anti-sigma-R factor [Actinomycetota bacterium]
MKQLCQETLERAYLLLDGEGSPAERAEIQQHLEACSPCYERYGLNAEVKSLIARLQGATPCPDGLRLKISEMLQLR